MTAVVAAITASTSHDRRSGWRAVNSPNSGPATMPTPTSSVSSALAAPDENPCPATRYGTPQSSANTVPENWVPMCVQSPSRVPGSRQDATSPAQHLARATGAGGGAGAPGGRSRTTASTASATATPSPAAETNAVVQPRAVQQRGERHRGQHLPELPDAGRSAASSSAPAGPGTRR